MKERPKQGGWARHKRPYLKRVVAKINRRNAKAEIKAPNDKADPDLTLLSAILFTTQYRKGI